MRRRLLYLIATLMLLATVSAIQQFIASFRRPAAHYDLIVTAPWFAAIASVCVIYDYRRTRRIRRGIDPMSPVKWRGKPELRALLYCFAVMLILQVPLEITKAAQKIRARPLPFRTTLWSEISADVFVYPLIAAAVVFYDRRRLRREAREDNFCPTCNYNLTGNTSGVCPECGTLVTVGKESVG